MKDSVWNISFHDRLNDYRENGGIRHHKTLSASSYPFEVRLKRDGIIVPQILSIHLIQYPPSSDKSLVVTLIVALVVKYQTLNKHLMGTIPSSITKLS